MITQYSIYESFLKKYDNNIELYKSIINDVCIYVKELFKEYKDYNIVFRNTVKDTDNNINSILIFDKDFQSTPISIIFYFYNVNINNNFVVDYQLNAREMFKNTYESKFSNVYDKKIITTICNNVKEIKEKFEDLNNIKRYLDNIIRTNNFHNLEYIISDTIRYDYITNYLLTKNIEYIKYVDLNRCSAEVKNKYLHLLDAKNFDIV